MKPSPQLSILCHPYLSLAALSGGRGQLRAAASTPGSALIWRMDPQQAPQIVELIERRPGGLALIVILPAASDIQNDPRLVYAVQRCRPHGILPGVQMSPEDLAQVLRGPPADLAADVTDYLTWRGLLHDRETRHLIRSIVDLSGEVKSITSLSRRLYISRRALGRRLMNKGLPVPSHWLQIGRILRVTVRLQNSDESVFVIACEAGYPDGFSLSNQMQRLMRVRPSLVRERLGWEWLLESWLRQEAESGGLIPNNAHDLCVKRGAWAGKRTRLRRHVESRTPRKS
jgi:AraC-like DNA-binding protein